MKYGYCFDDWSLYHIDELEEVKEMTEDYMYRDALSRCNFKKEDYYWVKSSKPIFIRARIEDGKIKFTEEYEGPYRKTYVFDTREEAEEYGKHNSSLNWY